MKLWKCPNGCGGVRAPERPRRDDVRRYCLRCSERSGRLVERSCASLERRRNVAALRSRSRAAEKRERERAKDVRAGIHVPTEFRRVWRVAHRLNPRLPKRPAELTVWSKNTGERSGHAYHHGGRVHLSISPTTSAGVVRALIAHEIAHPCRARARGEYGVHDDGFWTIAAEIAEAAYAVEVPPLTGATAYEKQCQLEKALQSVPDSVDE